MKLNYILKRIEPTQEERKSHILYESIEKTLHPADFTNDNRLGTFMQLLMLCSEERDNKVIANYTKNLLAFEYYVSVGQTKIALPFFNLALECYAVLTGMETVSITDKDGFIGEFRSLNLKGKWKRESVAVRNSYILSGAAHKLGIDLPLDELPADYCPNITSIKSCLFILAMGLFGAWMVLNSFNEYHAARFVGEPIPFLDALQPTEFPIVVVGLIIVVAEFVLLFWQYTPSYNRLMAKYYYWRFSRR